MRATLREIIVLASVLDALQLHAREQPTREVCGVLLGVWGSRPVVDAVVRGINILDAHDRYMLDAASLLEADDAAARRGASIIGFYHSHPNHYPIPSLSDRHTAWHGFVYLIVGIDAVGTGATCGWTIDHDSRVHPVLIAAASQPSSTR